MCIIGLCGYATVGKTTIANAYIQAHRGTRIGFADALKEDLAPLMPKGADKEVIRPVYVAYGEMWRRVNPRHWIDRVTARVQMVSAHTPPNDLVIIDDVRYSNEREWIESQGGVVVLVSRPNVYPANCAESSSIGEMINSGGGFKHWIHNSETIGDAVRRLRLIVVDHYNLDVEAGRYGTCINS